MPSRVTAVVRYAFGSSIVVPARRARVAPRNASCTMSSASPTDPVMPYAMENSSGRSVSSADPGTDPPPPARVARLPAELLARLLVGGPARGGHLAHHVAPGERRGQPCGQSHRWLGARDLGQVGQPLRDRRRVAVDHVVRP